MKNNNKGYSFVEMIIVIAIMMVMAGLGALTMSVVDSAKATSAGDTLNSQFAQLSSLTKAQSPDLAMRLSYDDTEGIYELEYGTFVTGSGFTVDATKDPITFSDKITIYFKNPSGVEVQIGGAGGASSVIIQFNKSDGSVLLGSGTYRVEKRNGDTVSEVVLNKNTGSHYVK